MLYFFFSSRRRHTRCALVTGVQTCALPITAQALMAEVGVLKERLPALEAEGARLGDELGGILATIPNLPLADVPEGADENDNVEVALHGTPPPFDFAPDRQSVGSGTSVDCGMDQRWRGYIEKTKKRD